MISHVEINHQSSIVFVKMKINIEFFVSFDFDYGYMNVKISFLLKLKNIYTTIKGKKRMKKMETRYSTWN